MTLRQEKEEGAELPSDLTRQDLSEVVTGTCQKQIGISLVV